MNEKGKNILLGILIVGLIGMTVAYAALSTTLNITGTASVAATTWDVHFANVSNATTTTGNSVTATNTGTVTSLGTLNAAAITSSSTGTAFSGLTVSLAKPGDWAEVNFDIVNTGSIDAKLSSFNKTIKKGTGTASTSDTNDGITYTITCGATRASGVKPVALAAAQELVKTNGKVECKLRVYYENLTNQNQNQAGKDQTYSGSATSARTFTLDASWVYIQK